MSSNMSQGRSEPAIITAEAIANAEDSAILRLRVKTVDSRLYSVELPLGATIPDLKEKVEAATNVSAGRQRLIFQGKVLRNDKSISFYSIRDGNTLHLVVRPDGASGQQEDNLTGATNESAGPAQPESVISYTSGGDFANMFPRRGPMHGILMGATITVPSGMNVDTRLLNSMISNVFNTAHQHMSGVNPNEEDNANPTQGPRFGRANVVRVSTVNARRRDTNSGSTEVEASSRDPNSATASAAEASRAGESGGREQDGSFETYDLTSAQGRFQFLRESSISRISQITDSVRDRCRREEMRARRIQSLNLHTFRNHGLRIYTRDLASRVQEVRDLFGHLEHPLRVLKSTLLEMSTNEQTSWEDVHELQAERVFESMQTLMSSMRDLSQAWSVQNGNGTQAPTASSGSTNDGPNASTDSSLRRRAQSAELRNPEHIISNPGPSSSGGVSANLSSSSFMPNANTSTASASFAGSHEVSSSSTERATWTSTNVSSLLRRVADEFGMNALRQLSEGNWRQIQPVLRWLGHELRHGSSIPSIELSGLSVWSAAAAESVLHAISAKGFPPQNGYGAFDLAEFLRQLKDPLTTAFLRLGEILLALPGEDAIIPEHSLFSMLIVTVDILDACRSRLLSALGALLPPPQETLARWIDHVSPSNSYSEELSAFLLSMHTNLVTTASDETSLRPEDFSSSKRRRIG